MQLNFEVFDFERDPSCRYDYVEIFDGRYESDRKLGRFCNKDPSPITSSGNEMRIQFRTNERNTRRGFVANWMETDVIPITLSVVTTQRTTSSQGKIKLVT